MRRTLFTLLLAALVAVPALAQGKDENPLKKAKVGDWATYKLNINAFGNEIAGEIKQTVTEMTEKTATVKAQARVADKDTPAQERKIDLTEPLDPLKMLQLSGQNVNLKKTEDGKEKVKIGDKTYESTWAKFTGKQKIMDNEFDVEIKMWSAKDAPLSGVVKMETKSDLANVTMELSGSGKGK